MFCLGFFFQSNLKNQTQYCCGKICVRHGSLLRLPRWDATGWVTAWQPQTATSNFPVSFTSISIQDTFFLPLTIQKLWLLRLLRTSQKTTTAVTGTCRITVATTALMWNYRPDPNSYCPGTSSGQSQLDVSQELPSSWCPPFSLSLRH